MSNCTVQRSVRRGQRVVHPTQHVLQLDSRGKDARRTTQEKTVSDSLSRQLSNIRDFEPNLELNRSNEPAFYFDGVDKFVEHIDNVIRDVSERAFTDDDRVEIRETRAFCNKFAKVVDQTVIQEKRSAFETAEEQRKLIVGRVKELSAQLSSALDKFDAEQREIKRRELSAFFNDCIDSADEFSHLSHITFEQIEDSSWSNRSTSDKKARAGVLGRLETINKVAKHVGSVDEAFELLVDSDWDALGAVDAKAEREAAARREKEEAERRQAELEEAERRGREAAEREAAERFEREEAERVAKEKREREEASRRAERDQSDDTSIVTVTYPSNKRNIVKHALNELALELERDHGVSLSVDF